ncbi:class I SAM-dependent methyltransferase [Wenxinia saemankumensis]
MHLDAVDLRAFYYRSALGRQAQRVIRDALVRRWPDVRGRTVAGFGFAVPLLRPFLPEARRVVGLMPGPQGVMHWPAGLPNVSVLCEETLWPLATGSVDRLVLLHGLETSDHPDALLAEAGRVLAPGGRAVFIVPNRAGLWSRSDATPFGYGRPYSTSQLEAQLRRNHFRAERTTSTLYQPPRDTRLWRRMAGVMESAGRHIPVFAAGGVLIAEASYSPHRPSRTGLTEAVRRPLRVLEGIAQPVPEPARRTARAGQGDAAGPGPCRAGRSAPRGRVSGASPEGCGSVTALLEGR